MEDELDSIITTMDFDEDLQALLGRDSGAFRNESTKLTNASNQMSEALWSQIRRLQSINKELGRGVHRRGEELLGVSQEVRGALSEACAQWEADYRRFLEENREVGQLAKDVTEGDRVRGFDLEDNLDKELILDLDRFEMFVGEEEKTMIENYLSGCEMLAEKRNLEVQIIEQTDVN